LLQPVSNYAVRITFGGVRARTVILSKDSQKSLYAVSESVSGWYVKSTRLSPDFSLLGKQKQENERAEVIK
jgi:hypothetical protein